MKKIFFIAFIALFVSFPFFSAEEKSSEENQGISDFVVEIPGAKRPVPADAEKLLEAEKRDPDGADKKSYTESIRFGTAGEISGTIDKILDSDDPRFIDELYDVFLATSNGEIKMKILEYFSKLKDPCLEDYAVEILDDPYDTKDSMVEKCFLYVSEVKSSAAAPALVKLLETGEERYFSGALSALGKTGGKKEAEYLSRYLEKDDLTVPQRQALMRTLGEMNAVETFDSIVKIAQDEDENGFVRMYACEAIGNMKKAEAVPVLTGLFQKGDPNMRQYCIKGLSNFPDEKKATNLIIQAIRDDHYKVRIEAIKASKELSLTDALEYLIYRSKNDSENAVKKECYPAIAKMNTPQGNEFLVSQLKEKKVPDATKKMICEALFENGEAGESEIMELSKESLKDDRRKDLRASLGKLFIKHARSSYAEIDILYLQSKDAVTVSQGLELYRKARYEEALPFVQAIAKDGKSKDSNRNTAKKILGIKDEPEENKDGTDKKGN